MMRGTSHIFVTMLCMHRNANGGPYSMPVHLRLTSVLGDAVYDTLPDWGGGQVGSVRNPMRKYCRTNAAIVALAWRPLQRHANEDLAT